MRGMLSRGGGGGGGGSSNDPAVDDEQDDPADVGGGTGSGAEGITPGSPSGDGDVATSEPTMTVTEADANDERRDIAQDDPTPDSQPDDQVGGPRGGNTPDPSAPANLDTTAPKDPTVLVDAAGDAAGGGLSGKLVAGGVLLLALLAGALGVST